MPYNVHLSWFSDTETKDEQTGEVMVSSQAAHRLHGSEIYQEVPRQQRLDLVQQGSLDSTFLQFCGSHWTASKKQQVQRQRLQGVLLQLSPNPVRSGHPRGRKESVVQK